ncbi:hypothetical protein E3T61_01555 [Cryobacterium lactosi]|uniref:Uncharacterized protein n=1 Tax=Cryobacterium lactosi TaxID=1259202 RepID=A0A4R9C1H3_9MICO|nr:hypothetical protein [Cryobacterium lactosi]TFD94846.1 hypothetical protein E3T61_01555 [Cryobacterium lactosi]
MAQARRDDDPYERALTDADFLIAVRAAHRGRWPVLDALWWWSHPAETAPSGSPSPAARLSALQRRLFGADGDAAGDGAVAQAARELDTEIAAERAAIGAALAAAGEAPADTRATAPRIGPPPLTPGADPADVGGDDAAGPADPDEAADLSSDSPTGNPAPPRRRVLLGAGLAGALVVGALVGSQVTAANRPGGQSPPATASSTGSATPSAVPVIAAQVFARVQTGQDIPRVPLPAAYDPASFRYLGAAGWRDSDANGVTDSPYYAARGAENMVCLVVVPEGAGYLTTCTPEDDFPSTGLRLSWESTDFLPMEQDGQAMVMDITVAWLSDSTIETRGSGRSLIP